MQSEYAVAMATVERMKSMVKSLLPAPALSALRRRRRARIILNERPASRCFGLDRGGRAIDRHYIETFLARHADDIRGRVLEVGDANYTRRFGGDRVQRSDVLHVNEGHPGATIVGELASGRGIPVEAFDCMICTQTLQFIYDVRAAVANICRALRPGGVALVTVPNIALIARFGMNRWGEHWRFTSVGARQLFSEAFGEKHVDVTAYGNSFAAICMLQGVTLEEMTRGELDRSDRDYEVIVAVRAGRAGSPAKNEGASPPNA
jgi:SAM-dependent methyltransferase